MPSPEQHSPEHRRHTVGSKEHYQGASRRLEQHHPSNEHSSAERAHKALAEASKEALSHTEYDRESTASKQETESRGSPTLTKKGLQQSFNKTMSQTQTHMSAPARIFSKVIHMPAVEKVSDIVGSTVARPDAILSGSIFAFAVTLVIYAIAKYVGFEITGTVAMASFVAGWLVGILFDMLHGLFRGRR